MMTDDDPDDLSMRLRAQPPATLPAHWREEILAAAAAHKFTYRSSRWQAAAEVVAGFAWPHPYAYAGLLAIWLLVLTLRLCTPAPTPPVPTSFLAQDTEGMNYPAMLARDLLALNATSTDASRKERRP